MTLNMMKLYCFRHIRSLNQKSYIQSISLSYLLAGKKQSLNFWLDIKFFFYKFFELFKHCCPGCGYCDRHTSVHHSHLHIHDCGNLAIAISTIQKLIFSYSLTSLQQWRYYPANIDQLKFKNIQVTILRDSQGCLSFFLITILLYSIPNKSGKMQDQNKQISSRYVT